MIISDYVKSVVAVMMGEIAFHKLPNEKGIFCYMEKQVGYEICRKALDLSWEWIERKNINEIDPWSFCCYLDDENGIDLIEYERDATEAGDEVSENIYGIMNCIILYIAYQAFEKAGEKYLPEYLYGIDDEFYVEGILNYATKIKGSPLYKFLLKKMPYETLWCIISLHTNIYERSDLIRQTYYTTTNT